MTVPRFATLTGADRPDLTDGMADLARRHGGRVEWGILIAEEKAGTPRFPDARTLAALRRSGLRLSAHLCGALADRIFAGAPCTIDLAGFSRVQVNLLGRHATPREIENAIGFGRNHGIRTILQCDRVYPDDPRADWLLDASFGTGRRLSAVPTMQDTRAFCGISGGLDGATVGAVIARAAPHLGDRSFWVDAESALFDGTAFCLARCDAFLSATFPQAKG